MKSRLQLLLLVLFAGSQALVATGRRDVLLGLLLAANPQPQNDAKAQLFESSCAACHAGGGNIVARGGKTLEAADLAKNGYTDLDSLTSIIANGKGAMPGYGEQCQPKRACTFGPRLADAEIRDIASYVQTQAGEGWPSP